MKVETDGDGPEGQAEMRRAVLDIKGLNVSYGDVPPSVRDVSLSVARGEIVGLIGESGSGKSTVAMACAGLLPRAARVAADHLDVCGVDAQGLDEKSWRRLRGDKVGTIFQDAMGALDPSMRIGNQLAEVIKRHRGLSGADARSAVVELLERVDVPEPAKRAKQYSYQLSGGLRQRVAIAMALAGDPELLLADEPTTALDVTVQAGILELFRRIRDEFGVGVLLISHDMGVIAQTADRVGVMLDGELVEHGEVDDVLLAPKANYTRDLLDAMPRVSDGEGGGSTSPQPPGSDASPAIFEVSDVRKSFKTRGQTVAAVRGISLEVRRGEVLSIVGESGSGKSTLAKMLVGLETPSGGKIRIDGELVTSRRARGIKGRLQMVFQHPLGSLNPKLRIQASVREPIHRAVSRGDANRRVRDAITNVGLPIDAGDRFPHEFSGGQAQRVAMARALIAEPEVVILDEPTSALDVSVQAQILDLLKEVKDQRDLTYVFISHDLAVVRQISDRVAVMYAGEIVEMGTTEDLFQNPRHWYTRALLSAVPSPDPRDRAAPLSLGPPAGSAGTQTAGGSCTFATRCPNVADVCHAAHPELLANGGRGMVACHRPADVQDPERSLV